MRMTLLTDDSLPLLHLPAVLSLLFNTWLPKATVLLINELHNDASRMVVLAQEGFILYVRSNTDLMTKPPRPYAYCGDLSNLVR